MVAEPVVSLAGSGACASFREASAFRDGRIGSRNGPTEPWHNRPRFRCDVARGPRGLVQSDHEPIRGTVQCWLRERTFQICSSSAQGYSSSAAPHWASTQLTMTRPLSSTIDADLISVVIRNMCCEE
eukprot:5718868-Pyramimonas_sp.AAC.1